MKHYLLSFGNGTMELDRHLVSTEDDTDMSALVDMMIDNLENEEREDCFLKPSETFENGGDYHEDEYIIGGNHGHILYHGGMLSMEEVDLSYDYSQMTEIGFERCKKREFFDESEYIGAVHVGNISIDILYYSEQKKFFFDYYVFDEESGYGYKTVNDCEIPYDYADGNNMNYVEDYDEFVKMAEPLFTEFIVFSQYRGPKSGKTLLERAKSPLVIW